MKLFWQIVRLNLKEIFTITYGNYTHREALIVSLHKNNCIGYGECTAIDYYQINLSEFVKKLEGISAGIEKQKIVHPTEFYKFLETLNLPSFLRSAIDCAYWDLFGKLEKKSFFELNTINIDRTPESSITISVDSVQKQISKIQSSTWTKFKVKRNHFNEKDITLLSKLERSIALDSNGSFTKANCKWIENQEFVSRFTYLEQPMKVGIENFKVLHSNLNANWMADEDCQDESSLELLQSHYKSINIKLMKCGGLTPALQLIKKARTLNFKIMIGCMTESSVGISAGAVLAPLVDYADLDGANLIANDIAVGSTIVNGKIQLSEKHGLGIELL